MDKIKYARIRMTKSGARFIYLNDRYFNLDGHNSYIISAFLTYFKLKFSAFPSKSIVDRYYGTYTLKELNHICETLENNHPTSYPILHNALTKLCYLTYDNASNLLKDIICIYDTIKNNSIRINLSCKESRKEWCNKLFVVNFIPRDGFSENIKEVGC